MTRHDDGVHYFQERRTVIDNGKPQNLAIEKIELSWPLVKVFGGIFALVAFVVWGTILIKEFQHGQEMRWTQIMGLVQKLSDATERTNARLEAISLEAKALREAPDIFKVQDLPNLCALLTEANKATGWRCPEIITQLAVDSRFKRGR